MTSSSVFTLHYCMLRSDVKATIKELLTCNFHVEHCIMMSSWETDWYIKYVLFWVAIHKVEDMFISGHCRLWTETIEHQLTTHAVGHSSLELKRIKKEGNRRLIGYMRFV